eukprot:1466600-Pleurochrysis_carterae.AAC.2
MAKALSLRAMMAALGRPASSTAVRSITAHRSRTEPTSAALTQPSRSSSRACSGHNKLPVAYNSECKQNRFTGRRTACKVRSACVACSCTRVRLDASTRKEKSRHETWLRRGVLARAPCGAHASTRREMERWRSAARPRQGSRHRRRQALRGARVLPCAQPQVARRPGRPHPMALRGVGAA